MRLSILSCVMAKFPKETELEDIVRIMRSSPKLRLLCEEYRVHDANGDKQGKLGIKRKKIPAFIPSALLYGGKGHRNIIGLTDLCFMDVDGINDKQINDTMKILREDAHVVLALRSMSGKGLHFFVRYSFKNMELPQITTMSYKRMAVTYSAVFNTLSLHYNQILHLPIDESCKNAVQTCNISYDEDLYYNPDALPYSLIYEHQKVGKQQKTLQIQ